MSSLINHSRRRLFRFSLRTLLAFAFTVALICGAAAYLLRLPTRQATLFFAAMQDGCFDQMEDMLVNRQTELMPHYPWRQWSADQRSQAVFEFDPYHATWSERQFSIHVPRLNDKAGGDYLFISKQAGIERYYGFAN